MGRNKSQSISHFLYKNQPFFTMKKCAFFLYCLYTSCFYMCTMCYMIWKKLLCLALSSIPKIVCEAISSLDLQHEVPSWKIMENRGRITIVLTWDQRQYGPTSSGASSYFTRSHPPALSAIHRHDAFARHISPSSLSPQSSTTLLTAAAPAPGPPSPILPTASNQSMISLSRFPTIFHTSSSSLFLSCWLLSCSLI